MDNHTRKLLGSTDKHLFFDEEWLTKKQYKCVQAHFISGRLDDSPSIANTADWLSLSVTIRIRHAQNSPYIGLSFILVSTNII